MNKKTFTLIVLLASYLLPIFSQTQIIAHRGYWKTEGSSQNSIAALMKADSIKAYGSEVDVWLSSDGVPVVNHDALIVNNGDSLVVQDTSFERLRKVKLSNGEPLPTFEEYLDAFEKCTHTKLIVEFKVHRTSLQERELATKVVDMINNRGLENRVEYISFGINFINVVKELAPNAPSYYLNGDLAPSVIKSIGISGIDYNVNVIKNNPEWVAECHSLGLKVNVWTVNKVEDINNMLDLSVDFITTDEPLLTREIIEGRK